MQDKNERTDREGRKFTVEVSKPDQCTRVLSIGIPASEVAKEEKVLFQKLKSDLKIPGFRKGRVPSGYIEKNYGEVIHSDAVRNLLPAVYEEAVIQEGLIPLGEPRFDNLKAEREEDVTVEVTIEVRPEVKVEGYRNVKVIAAKKEIRDEDVELAIGNLMERMASFKVVDREARDGDYLIIDYTPVEDGEILTEKSVKNYGVDLGSESLLKEFREELKGLKVKEEKTFDVNYPDDFPDGELAGKKKTFHVVVREIKEKVLPDLNDEFVKSLGGSVKTVDELRARVREDLAAEEEKRYKHEVEEKIIDELIKRNQFEVPSVMVENYLSSILEEDRRRRPNASSEEARQKEIRELFYDSAVRTIKKYFIIDAIKRQENIEVTEDELNSRIEQLAGSGDRAEEVKAYFARLERRSKLKDEISDEKVLNLLRDAADIDAS